MQQPDGKHVVRLATSVMREFLGDQRHEELMLPVSTQLEIFRHVVTSGQPVDTEGKHNITNFRHAEHCRGPGNGLHLGLKAVVSGIGKTENAGGQS